MNPGGPPGADRTGTDPIGTGPSAVGPVKGATGRSGSAPADLVVIGAGQSGLAAAAAATARGLRTVVVDRAPTAGGAWRQYWDSLVLFSPARFAALPGHPLDGDPERYPRRDEIVAYLDGVAAGLDAELRTDWPVDRVRRSGGGGFVVDGPRGELPARRIINATGRYGRPRRPVIPGLDDFTGTVRHTAHYRVPQDVPGPRVVVIGAANSAVQIGAELSGHGRRVTLASRRPVRWVRQRPGGRDMHWWLDRSGISRLPVGALLAGRTTPVLDDGRWRAAFASDRLDRRPLPLRIGVGAAGDEVLWADGSRERVDVILLATGYEPDVDHLAGTGALDADGHPRHRRGVSTTVPGLGYVGLELQRTIASATLRGVARDAESVVRRLLRQR